MSVYKRFCVGFAASFLLFVVGFGGFLALLWLYDPFQFFHKPIFRETTYHGDMRVQAKGIIDHTEFDSVILGTSMLENTSAKEAGEKLGGKWINLSFGSSRFKERAIVLDYLFERKKIKFVIQSLDIHHLLYIEPIVLKPQLYSDNLLWQFSFIMDIKFAECAIRWSKKAECVGKYADLETATHWIKEAWHSSRFGGFNKWLENYENEQIKDTLDKLKNIAKSQILPLYKSTILSELTDKSIDNMTNNIIYFVKKYPNVNFYFIIPTYSRLFYRLDETQDFAMQKAAIAWLVKELANFSNAKIYGFDDLTYADEIANYKDLTHYNVNMNSMQLDAIASGTHILTPQNIENYLATMEAKIKAYDLTPLINEIKAWEVEQNKSKNKEKALFQKSVDLSF